MVLLSVNYFIVAQYGEIHTYIFTNVGTKFAARVGLGLRKFDHISQGRTEISFVVRCYGNRGYYITARGYEFYL